MTAATQQGGSTPPRFLIRTFWILHRAIVRVTGGRIGLARPTAGKRFGLMRLTTIGRRSGQARVAMIGYYPDGENLVTLAMNGWADADPAWWLNLQERPETTVELPDGRRAVRARAAAGPERERLWALFREYPGWGADLEALAARRDRPTAVVVLEPQSAAPADRRAPDGTEEGGARAATLAAAVDRSRGPKPRHLWLVPGLAIAIWANAVAGEHGLGLIPLLAFGIAPHLPALAGVGRPHARGQLVAPAVPLFNALHHPVGPTALLAVAAVGLLSPFWLVGAMAWLSHIVIDWALGDGMRTADGFVRRLAPAIVVDPVR